MQVEKEFDEMLQLIGFTVGEEMFAIDISDVHEINRFEHINRIPDLPDHVLGVIDLRGMVIPVINLAEKLGTQRQDVTKDTRIIIVGFKEEKIGILVDSVSEVLRISPGSLERPPSIIKNIDAEYISGIIRNCDKLTVVLDLQRLFKDFEPSSTREHAGGYKETGMIMPGENREEVVDKIVEVTKAMSEGDFHREIDGDLYGQIGEIAKYINATIKRLQTVEPNIAVASDNIPAASMQLSEITKATEEATHGVMTHVEHVLDSQDLILHNIEAIENGENISRAAEEIKQVVADNREALMDIMTGLSFQDLTGQKIKAIISLIGEIEKRIIHLIVTFGLKSKENIKEDSPLKDLSENSVLEQELVDSILKEFGFE